MPMPLEGVRILDLSVFQQGTHASAMLADLGAEFRRHTAGHDSPPAELPLPRGAVNAIFAPHIDYIRGGEVYNWSYRAIAEHGVAAETYFILGVVHRTNRATDADCALVNFIYNPLF